MQTHHVIGMLITQTAEYGSFRRDLGCEKEQILAAGGKNSCQVRIMSELRGKSNKVCVKNNENETFRGRFKCKI